MTQEPPATTTSDRALLRSIRAWGGDFAHCSSRFSQPWRDRLGASWPSLKREKPDASWAGLRVDHQGSSRPDSTRVHPSWYVRALKSESPAVRLAVVAHAPPTLREALRRGLEIDPAELATDRLADPEALGWALALWSERIVGDVPGLETDPPVVVALTRLGFRELARLIKVCGLAKHAFAIEGAGPTGFDEEISRFSPLDRVRVGFFRRHIGAADPRLIPQARLDLQAIEGDRRRAHARVGLVTFGRLLEAVEPHRARWSVQHVPYPIARRMRIKDESPISRKSMLAWESWILEAAWTRLLAEGRLTGNRGLGPSHDGKGAGP